MQGFTLVEVLAGLAISGLIMVLIISGLRYGQTFLQSRERLADARADLSAVDRTLRTLIEAAWPGGVGSADVRFTGSARGLAFRTTMPAGLGGGFRAADVTIGTDAAHQLTVAWTPWFRNWITPRPAPTRVGLLTGVDHLECSYWSPGFALPPGQWMTTWNGTTPPKLVRLRLVFAANTGRHWPDIIVATGRDPRVN